MHSDELLDLGGIVQPYCLLQCKSVLASMKPGSLLTIRLRDPSTYGDMLKILDRSGEIIESTEKTEEGFVIRVRKSASANRDDPMEPDS